VLLPTLLFDHPAVDDGRLSAVEEIAGRRRDGAAEDQSVDALSHGWFGWLADTFVAHWLQINGVGANTWGFLLTTVLTLTTGTIFVMWLGEQDHRTRRGEWHLSVDLCRHCDRPARGVQQVMGRVSGGDTLEILGVIGLVVALVAIIAFIVFVEAARRKITGQLCQASRRAPSWLADSKRRCL